MLENQIYPSYQFVSDISSHLIQQLSIKNSSSNDHEFDCLVPLDKLSTISATYLADEYGIVVKTISELDPTEKPVIYSTSPQESALKENFSLRHREIKFVCIANKLDSKYPDLLLTSLQDCEFVPVTMITKDGNTFIDLDIKLAGQLPKSRYVTSKSYTANGLIRYSHNSDRSKINARLKRVSKLLIFELTPKIFDPQDYTATEYKVYVEELSNSASLPNRQVVDFAIKYSSEGYVQFDLDVKPS